ncbi:MAG: peptide chain release factor N(5)-glutamine methyltransferase [Magnetovibrionaceae bacterium]
MLPPRTCGEALDQTTQRLKEAGLEDARSEARLLVEAATGLSRSRLFGFPETEVTPEQALRLRELADRRAGGEPVARLSGVKEFWSLPFLLSDETLVPRPDSETLVELALTKASKDEAMAILDLGTGSGCLLLSLLHELPNAVGIGVDLAPGACRTAGRNAQALGLDARAMFCQGNWTSGVQGPFDLIVSNPPYIRAGDIPALSPEVRDHDPLLALDGGQDGLDAYRHLASVAPALLNPGGWVVFEIGFDQAEAVSVLLAAVGMERIEAGRDLAGRDRVIAARQCIGPVAPR